MTEINVNELAKLPVVETFEQITKRNAEKQAEATQLAKTIVNDAWEKFKEYNSKKENFGNKAVGWIVNIETWHCLISNIHVIGSAIYFDHLTYKVSLFGWPVLRSLDVNKEVIHLIEK
jgi:hypothetical protein